MFFATTQPIVPLRALSQATRDVFLPTSWTISLREMRQAIWIVIAATILGPKTGYAQRLPERAKPPTFQRDQFRGVFLEDVRTGFTGQYPNGENARITTVPSADRSNATALPTSESSKADSKSELAAGSPFEQLISPETIEDLVKGTKLRLDKIITTPAAFNSNGFKDARLEFSLLAVLFTVIELDSRQVRWSESASLARDRFARVAANSKVGSRAVYNESKARMTDLEELLAGTKLSPTQDESPNEVKAVEDWSTISDRTTVMKLLERVFVDSVQPGTSNAVEFQTHLEKLNRDAEIMATLGRWIEMPGMDDANDQDYLRLSNDMKQHALTLHTAVQSKNADAARMAVGSLGQSCTNCHDTYR